jgi:serine phosphatase RsbU (regulator of sigma subunit)
VRYLPAEQASRVGGDWYHAAATDDGEVLLAVGDVAGHGIRAATSMARLRHALDALSITATTDPAELLGSLNRLLYAGGSIADTATAVIARYHPPTGRLVWAQAGHPPILRTRDAVTTELERPRGALLGAVRDAVYHTASTTVEAGDLLLFYTDGLVEDRRRSRQEGFAPVIDTLNTVSARAGGQPLSDVLDLLRRANPDDDICILAARPSAVRPAAAEAGRP